MKEKTTWKHRRRLEDNIETDLEGIGWEGVDWIYPTRHRDS